MFRLWGKMWKDNHMLKDLVIDDDSEDTRTHKIFHALQEICNDIDMENPILNAMARHVFIRTVLLNISSLIILKFR